MNDAQRPLIPGLVAAVIGVGAIAVVLAAVPSQVFDLDRFSVAKETALLATATVALVLLLARRERVDLGVAELSLAAFSAWSLVSGVFAYNHWLSARAVGLTLGGAAIFVTARYAAERGWRRPLIGLLALAVVVGGATGLAQAYGWRSELLADTRAPGGTLGNRNFLAHLMVLGLPLAGWLMLSARNRLVTALAGLATSAMVAAVVLSRSRAAWVGFAAVVVAIVLVGALTRGPVARVPRGRLARMVAALAIGAGLALLLPNELEWKSASPYRDSLRHVLNYREGSGRGRLIQYRNSLQLVARHPIVGVGPGNWLVAYPLVTTPADPSFAAADPIPTNPWPSSDWVALITERGPIGVALYLLWLLSLTIVAFRRVKDPELGLASLAAIGLMVGLTVQGAFDAVGLLAPPAIIAMAGLGALLPATRPVTAPAPTGAQRSRLLVWLVPLLLAASLRSGTELKAILTAGVGWPRSQLEDAVRWDPGSYRLRILLAQRSPCPEAGEHAVRAAELLPFHPWPRRLTSRCR